MTEPSREQPDIANCGNDWSGCIDGAWYVPCENGLCDGLCEYTGRCPCEGCDNERCCRKETP